MHFTVHLICHIPHISTNAFQHDERYRQRLHGAEERLVMKQSVYGPALQVRVWPCMLRISMQRTVGLPVPTPTAVWCSVLRADTVIC
jgi:hypothetical protein